MPLPYNNPTDRLVTGQPARGGSSGRGRVGAAGDRLAGLAGIDPGASMVSSGAGAPSADRLAGLAAIPAAPRAGGGPRAQMPTFGRSGGGLPTPQGISDHRSSLPAGGDYKSLLLQDLREQLAEARAAGNVEAEMAIMEKIAEVSATPSSPAIETGPGGFSRYGADPALSRPTPGVQTPDAPPITSTMPLEEINQFAGMARARDDREEAFARAQPARMATDPQAEANRRPETDDPYTPGGGNMDTGLAGLGRAQAQAATARGDRGVIGGFIDRALETAPGAPGADRYAARVASELGGGPAGDTSGHGAMSMDGAAVDGATAGGLAAVPPRPTPRPGGAPSPRAQGPAGGGLAAVPSPNQPPPMAPPPAAPAPAPEGDTAGFGDMLLDDPEQNRRDTQEMAKAVTGAKADASDVPEWALPLLAAGLGMMASNNPNGMAAIGEGGLAGLKSWLGVKQANDKRQERKEDVEYRQARLEQDDAQAREANATQVRLAKLEAETAAPYREAQIRAANALADQRSSAADRSGSVTFKDALEMATKTANEAAKSVTGEVDMAKHEQIVTQQLARLGYGIDGRPLARGMAAATEAKPDPLGIRG
jgi:hypothetical protein